VLLHGLVIWDAPIAQAAAVAVAAGMVAVTIAARQRGAFRSRSVVELRREPERDLGHLGVTVSGHSGTADVEIDGRPAPVGAFEDFSAVHTVTVRLPAGAPAERSVWAHHVSPDGESTSLPATVDVDGDTMTISLTNGGPR
jgi:hypothetical protein